MVGLTSRVRIIDHEKRIESKRISNSPNKNHQVSIKIPEMKPLLGGLFPKNSDFLDTFHSSDPYSSH